MEQVAERIAVGQHGVVTRGQILSAGCAARTLERRVTAGRLRTVHCGVYTLGPVQSPAMEEMAAVLACGRHAFVSHLSAGVLWRILRPDARPTHPHVTLVGTNRARPGIRIHRVAELAPDERSARDGIPLTSPSRTLYDLASLLEPRALEQAVAEAIALRLVALEALAAAAERYRGRRGAGRFRDVVQGDARPSRTRSTAEERFLALVRKAGVGRPKLNTPVAGHEVDFFWPEHRLVVEVDGRAYHSSPKAVDRDRRRDADLATAGYRVLRITWREIVHHPEALLVRLGRALAAGR
ncbi:MAG: type IV toxin-antitoxin system AbiEi family antitoxin domain-containing protein [Gemmatimonadota bacterium]